MSIARLGIPDDRACGYAHPHYPEVEAGQDCQPLFLEASGGWLLKREVTGVALSDARAPYPFLVCCDWSRLSEDLAALPPDLASVTAVTDPFAEVRTVDLERAFPDMVRPYKAHFVIDLTRPLNSFANPLHLRCARRALRKLKVGTLTDPAAHLNDWMRLYGNLVARHNIRGPSRLSEEATRRLLRLPGLTVFRAQWQDATIGMIWCIDDGIRAWFHLGAYDEEGYRRNASHAIVLYAIDYFTAAGLAIMNIGAGAGAFGDGTDGLTTFKRGWASGTRMTYLCGRIHNPDVYVRLVESSGTAGSPYFPAYRTGEYD